MPPRPPARGLERCQCGPVGPLPQTAVSRWSTWSSSSGLVHAEGVVETMLGLPHTERGEQDDRASVAKRLVDVCDVLVGDGVVVDGEQLGQFETRSLFLAERR